MRVQVKIRNLDSPDLTEQQVESSNISARGVYFSTDLPLDIGARVEMFLRISGALLILGIVVEIISLLWEKPLAFLLFVGVAGALTFLGIVLYLYSLLPPTPEAASQPPPKIS